MYNTAKRDEMLKNGFWPINVDGVEQMATALGNILYRPELIEEFDLDDGELWGEAPGVIIVYTPD